MPRAPNAFSYQSPINAIGGGLVRAIFGDPAARIKQQTEQSEEALRQAQADEAAAHGTLYTNQAAAEDARNTAGQSLPALFQTFARSQQPAPPPMSVGSPGFSDFDTPLPQPEPKPDGPTALAALLTGLGQFQGGDHIDPTQMLGSYGAFAGSDELARRGLVAQGHSPTADFAITPERADQIARNDATSKLEQALGVARTNHASDLPVAYVQAGTARRGQDIAASTGRYGIDTAATTSRRGQDITAATRQDEMGFKAGAPGFDAIQSVFPGARETSGWRSAEHNAAVGGVANSNHLGLRPGVSAFDLPAQPGVSVQEAAARIEEKNPNVKVIEARDEAGRHGPNGKALGGWHFALQSIGDPAKAGAAKQPKLISPTQNKAIATEVTDQLAARNLSPSSQEQTAITATASDHYLKTGNLTGAVSQAITEAGVKPGPKSNFGFNIPKLVDGPAIVKAAGHLFDTPKAKAPPPGATRTATGPGGKKVALVGGKWVSY